MNYNVEADRFLKRYEATGELSRHKMYAERPSYHLGRMIDYDPFTTATFQIDRKPYVEVNIPQHRFRELVERHEWYEKLEQESDYYKRIVERFREDDRVRDRNPTVQKAYEKYKMLLELAR